MKNRSEGVRRITLLFSFILSIGWLVIIFFLEDNNQSSGMVYQRYKYDYNGQLSALDNYSRSSGFDAEYWIISLVGFLIAFCLPFMVNKVTYWIIDGFKNDKKLN